MSNETEKKIKHTGIFVKLPCDWIYKNVRYEGYDLAQGKKTIHKFSHTMLDVIPKSAEYYDDTSTPLIEEVEAQAEEKVEEVKQTAQENIEVVEEASEEKVEDEGKNESEEVAQDQSQGNAQDAF